jgi:hypothetical protein
MRKSAAKEHVLLAVMAGQASAHDDRAAAVGSRIEAEAKATWPTSYEGPDELDQSDRSHRGERPTLLGRLKAALAA